MKKFLKPLALVGLLLTVAPPLLLFLGMIDSLASVKAAMLAGMILWFATAVPWLVFSETPNTHDPI